MNDSKSTTQNSHGLMDKFIDMQKLLVLSIFTAFVVVIATNIAVANESGGAILKNGVRTVSKLVFPNIKDAHKKELNICWRGKLCWVDGHWERQIVLYNGSKKPPFEHPIYDYVKNLPAPDYKGEQKYEEIFAEEFECDFNNQRQVIDFRPQYDVSGKKDFRFGEGTAPNTGNREKDRRLAKISALRSIVEQFGVKLESETIVNDYQLASDVIKTKANKKVQFVPAIEQYHTREGQNEFQVVIWGWLDE